MPWLCPPQYCVVYLELWATVDPCCHPDCEQDRWLGSVRMVLSQLVLSSVKLRGKSEEGESGWMNLPTGQLLASFLYSYY